MPASAGPLQDNRSAGACDGRIATRAIGGDCHDRVFDIGIRYPTSDNGVQVVGTAQHRSLRGSGAWGGAGRGIGGCRRRLLCCSLLGRVRAQNEEGGHGDDDGGDNCGNRNEPTLGEYRRSRRAGRAWRWRPGETCRRWARETGRWRPGEACRGSACSAGCAAARGSGAGSACSASGRPGCPLPCRLCCRPRCPLTAAARSGGGSACSASGRPGCPACGAGCGAACGSGGGASCGACRSGGCPARGSASRSGGCPACRGSGCCVSSASRCCASGSGCCGAHRLSERGTFRSSGCGGSCASDCGFLLGVVGFAIWHESRVRLADVRSTPLGPGRADCFRSQVTKWLNTEQFTKSVVYCGTSSADDESCSSTSGLRHASSRPREMCGRTTFRTSPPFVTGYDVTVAGASDACPRPPFPTGFLARVVPARSSCRSQAMAPQAGNPRPLRHPALRHR